MRPASVLMICVLALVGIGVVMVHSAGMRIDDAKLGDPMAVFRGANAMYAGLALLAFCLVSRLNATTVLESRGPMAMLSPAMLLLIGAVALTVLAQVPGIGKPVNGAWRWIRIGPIQFQPSELVKYAVVVAMAWWAARGTDMTRFRTGLLPALIALAICCGVVVREDLGTAVLIGTVGLLVLLAAGAKWWQVGLVVPPALVAAAALVATSAYRRQRITAFLDPWQDSAGSGYHAIQSLLAFAGGGVTGRGLGGGIQKFGYVPEDTTDFIFAIIAEELGLAGCGVVIALYLVLLWAGLQVVRSTPNRFGALLALGITLTIALQATLNIAVVTVTVPTKGIALPLISRGGTGWLATAAALGLVASLDRRNAAAGLGMVGAMVGLGAAQSPAKSNTKRRRSKAIEEDVDEYEYEYEDEAVDEADEENEAGDDEEYEYEEGEYEEDEEVDEEEAEYEEELEDEDVEDKEAEYEEAELEDGEVEGAGDDESDEDEDEYEYEYEDEVGGESDGDEEAEAYETAESEDEEAEEDDALEDDESDEYEYEDEDESEAEAEAEAESELEVQADAGEAEEGESKERRTPKRPTQKRRTKPRGTNESGVGLFEAA